MLPHIMTRSGLPFEFEDPHPSAFDLDDIACSLARICRFNGQYLDEWPGVYSVAQHSVYVYRLLKKFGTVPNALFWALMHDACEAYYGDTITPLKNLFPELEAMEGRAAIRLRDQWGIPFSSEIAAEVHWADKAVGCAEAFVLKGRAQGARMYGRTDPPFEMSDFDPGFELWSFERARDEFLAAYAEIKQQTIEQDRNRAHAA
jgi:uncharacterized protein